MTVFYLVLDSRNPSNGILTYSLYIPQFSEIPVNDSVTTIDLLKNEETNSDLDVACSIVQIWFNTTNNVDNKGNA